MAKINPPFPVSGRVGNVVFRRCGPDIIMARRPRASSVPPSDRQLEQQARFRMAAIYAKAVYADPPRKEMYSKLAERRGVHRSRLFAFIARDYQVPPKIQDIDVSDYLRQVGDAIRIHAVDDVEVVAVAVRICRLDDGTLLEQGAAVYDAPFWRYTAQTAAPPGIPLVVEATAIDHADNHTIERIGIPT